MTVPGVVLGYSVIVQMKTPAFSQDSIVERSQAEGTWAGMVSSVSQVSAHAVSCVPSSRNVILSSWSDKVFILALFILIVRTIANRGYLCMMSHFIQLVTFRGIFDHTIKSYDVKTFTTVRIYPKNPYVLFFMATQYICVTFITYPPKYLIRENVRGNLKVFYISDSWYKMKAKPE